MVRTPLAGCGWVEERVEVFANPRCGFVLEIRQLSLVENDPTVVKL